MKAVREGMPDLVHSHLGPSFHWCSLASISCRDPVYVTTEHAVTNRRMAIPLLRGFERWCYRRNAALVCVSDSVAGSLAAWLGPDHPRIEVIPNGVETGHFDRILYPDPVLAQWKGERKLIVMTGRLVPEKDHATAIRALAALPPGFLIAFVGEGPLRPELEKASSKAGIGDRCRFLGTRVDLPAILATADIYLQSSRIEGFGIACLEAMSAGVPVVASEVGGLADLVRGAGALFPNGNARECARLIMELADNPALAAELSARGRERAATLSMSTVASRYSEMYQRAMKVDARERKTT
jgi:glycosyltransferase involved in cell wall biosynthesis